MERIKLSLKTRDAPDPVAGSRNRPADVVRLTTSNLPELSWAATATSPPPPALDVNDLLDLLSPSAPPAPASSAAGQQQQQQYPSSSLPAYQPKYTLSSREGQDKHALFFNNGSSGAAPPPPSSSPWGGTSGSQRYPQVADVRLPPPALLDQAQMQRLQLGPSAGPTLGPQEIEVGQGQPWVRRRSRWGRAASGGDGLLSCALHIRGAPAPSGGGLALVLQVSGPDSGSIPGGGPALLLQALFLRPAGTGQVLLPVSQAS